MKPETKDISQSRKKGRALVDAISSEYFSAANALKGKSARKRIVAYVESYEDILFWRMVLSDFEDEKQYFEVMLPSKSNLSKGKKQALISLMSQGGGENMIACVDADYDYLLQGKTYQSDFLLNNPFVVHTYVYAIENYQCYAPSLHNVCVMSTLNDHIVFDFVEFLTRYSKILFPLFVWSIMVYRKREYHWFTITDFNNVVGIRHSQLPNIDSVLSKLSHKVHVKLQDLRRNHPGLKDEYIATRDSLIELGVTPETTYLFIQGHHLFDSIVAPTVQTVCDILRREREREIRSKARHSVQLQNELSSYNKSQSDIVSMLKKNQGYTRCTPYKRMQQDIERILGRLQEKDSSDATPLT